jgi:CRAL/TRIO domain/CRAL/TRIO, N-terminal domain
MERRRPAELPCLVESLNEEERKTLDRFREAVPGKWDDHTLARFLRARKFEYEKALEMFSKYIQWRQDQHVDSIESFDFPEIAAIKQYYPHGFHKTDRLGRSIYIERYGSIDMKKIFEITTEERMIRYYIREYESMIKLRIPACAVAAGYAVEQTLTILDLGGSSSKLMKKNVYNFVKLASGIAQDYYPEILGRMFIINTPMLFSAAWAVIKPWLDERTKKKISTEGSKFQSKLLELVAPENLPDFLGGTCNCPGGCLSSDAGPWQNPEIMNRVRELNASR